MDEEKDINPFDRERDQRLRGDVSLEGLRPEIAKLQIVGFFVHVPENFKDNITNTY